MRSFLLLLTAFAGLAVAQSTGSPPPFYTGYKDSVVAALTQANWLTIEKAPAGDTAAFRAPFSVQPDTVTVQFESNLDADIYLLWESVSRKFYGVLHDSTGAVWVHNGRAVVWPYGGGTGQDPFTLYGYFETDLSRPTGLAVFKNIKGNFVQARIDTFAFPSPDSIQVYSRFQGDSVSLQRATLQVKNDTTLYLDTNVSAAGLYLYEFRLFYQESLSVSRFLSLYAYPYQPPSDSDGDCVPDSADPDVHNHDVPVMGGACGGQSTSPFFTGSKRTLDSVLTLFGGNVVVARFDSTGVHLDGPRYPWPGAYTMIQDSAFGTAYAVIVPDSGTPPGNDTMVILRDFSGSAETILMDSAKNIAVIPLNFMGHGPDPVTIYGRYEEDLGNVPGFSQYAGQEGLYLVCRIDSAHQPHADSLEVFLRAGSDSAFRYQTTLGMQGDSALYLQLGPVTPGAHDFSLKLFYGDGTLDVRSYFIYAGNDSGGGYNGPPFFTGPVSRLDSILGSAAFSGKTQVAFFDSTSAGPLFKELFDWPGHPYFFYTQHDTAGNSFSFMAALIAAAKAKYGTDTFAILFDFSKGPGFPLLSPEGNLAVMPLMTGGSGGPGNYSNQRFDVHADYRLDADSGKPGLVVHFNWNPDSFTVNAATGAKLELFLAGPERPRPAKPDTVRTLFPNERSGQILLRGPLPAGDYDLTARLVHDAGADSLRRRMTVGVVLKIAARQKISIDLARLAGAALERTSAPTLANLYENGKPIALPPGNVYEYFDSVPKVESTEFYLTFEAAGIPLDLRLKVSGGFDDLLFEPGIAGKTNFYTLDGNVQMKMEGKGFEGDSFESPVHFDSAEVFMAGGTRTGFSGNDTGPMIFFSGSTPGEKRLYARAVDTLTGISVEGPAGKIFHLDPAQKTVAVASGSQRYYSAGDAVDAGETQILLDSGYAGMPLVILRSDVTVTGTLLGAGRPVIDGSGNPACMMVEDARNVAVKGLHFQGFDVAGVALRRSEGLTLSQCRFSKGFVGIAGMREHDSHDSSGAQNQNQRVSSLRAVNCIFDSLSGLAVIIESPDACQFVNNTIHDCLAGVVLLSHVDEEGPAPQLSPTDVTNNLFSRLPWGGLLFGKDNLNDPLPSSVKNNLFFQCDSGEVVVLLGDNGDNFQFNRQLLPTTNLTAAASPFAVEGFPYALGAGSPAQDAGKEMTGVTPAADFLGVPRQYPIDIGALELESSTVGVSLISLKTVPGALFAKVSLVAPPGAAGGTPRFELEKEGAALSPRVSEWSAGSALTLYPLPDGNYRMILTADFTDSVTNLARSFADTGTFEISGGSLDLPAKVWSMTGRIDSAALSDSAFYRWNPQLGSYEALGEAGFTGLHRGEACWTLPDAALSFQPESTLFSPADTAAFTLPLAAGWNMLSSPFLFPVAIRDSARFYYYTEAAGYTEDQVLLPGRGAFYFSPAAETLTLAYRPSLPAAAAAAKAFYSGRDDFSVALDVVAGNFKDLDNRAGVHRGAAAGWDAFDLPEPPAPMGNGISAYFEFPGAHAVPLQRSVAPPANTVFWTLTVEPRGWKGGLTISAPGAEAFPKGKFLWLGNPALGFQDLKTSSVMTLETDGTKRKLLLAVSDDPNVGKALFKDFELYDNRPNPFNPSTRIEFFIPYSWNDASGLSDAPRRMKIPVMDIRGRRVALAADGGFRAGMRHSVTWNARGSDGRPLPSGVYFYTLQSGNFSKTRKMILLR